MSMKVIEVLLFLFWSLVSRVMGKPVFAYTKTEAKISCAVNMQLISTFVFAT